MDSSSVSIPFGSYSLRVLLPVRNGSKSYCIAIGKELASEPPTISTGTRVYNGNCFLSSISTKAN